MLDLTVIYFFSVFIFFVYLVIKNISHKENNYQQHFYNMFVLLILYFFIFMISILFISKKLLFPSGILFLIIPPLFFILYKFILKNDKHLGFHFLDSVVIFGINLFIFLVYYHKMDKNRKEINMLNGVIQENIDSLMNLDNQNMQLNQDMKMNNKKKYKLIRQIKNDMFLHQVNIKKYIDELLKKYAPLMPFYNFVNLVHFVPNSLNYML